MTSFQLGPWLVEASLNRARQNSRVVQLEPKIMQVLVRLAETPGEVVKKEDLIRAVWPDTFVTDDVLTRSISELRRTFGDDSRNPTYIETIPRSGYRLLVAASPHVPEPVVKPNGNGSAVAPAEYGDTVRVPQPWWKSRALVGYFLALGLALFVAWYFGLRLRRPPTTIHSVAVLPLQNLSGDPAQEYFADGSTDELITAFARVTDLRVTSRTSIMQLKGVQKSAKEIGQMLNVDALVEGSIARAKDRVRITVQLIDAHEDRHLWANEYEGSADDMLLLQQRVANDIASQVSARRSSTQDARMHAPQPVKAEAHDLYLRAKQYAAQWNEPGMITAIDLYRQAIRLQPDYAAAYVGLADAHSLFGTAGAPDTAGEWAQVREAASKALSFDSSVPGAHRYLAWVKHIYDWDTTGAYEEFQEALKTDRDNAETHMRYALFLAQIGRVEEGLAEAQLAEELDPLSSRISAIKEKIFMIARRYDDVFKQAKRTRELYPDNFYTALQVLQTYELLGRLEESIDEFEAHPAPGVMTQQEATAIANRVRSALRSEGPRGYWSAQLKEKREIDPDDHCLLSLAYFRAGDHDNGYRQLELAIKARDRNLRQMKTDPRWDFVRDDARFQDVLRRVGY
jgi:TolB-like protein/DNA-binding winged helix-turn-helix (wHTH) protein/Tfp pilus assembly protein PilF